MTDNPKQRQDTQPSLGLTHKGEEMNTDLIDRLGGEPLSGSGFENEAPDDEFEWRD